MSETHDYTIQFLDRPITESKPDDNGEVRVKGSLHPTLIGYTEDEAVEKFLRYQRANPQDRLEMKQFFTDRVVLTTAQAREQGLLSVVPLSQPKETV